MRTRNLLARLSRYVIITISDPPTFRLRVPYAHQITPSAIGARYGSPGAGGERRRGRGVRADGGGAACAAHARRGRARLLRPQRVRDHAPRARAGERPKAPRSDRK
eukprot:3299161-Pyramimonas_sp.AAC.1